MNIDGRRGSRPFHLGDFSTKHGLQELLKDGESHLEMIWKRCGNKTSVLRGLKKFSFWFNHLFLIYCKCLYREHQQQALCRNIPGTFWKEHKQGQHDHVDQTKNLKGNIFN